MRYILGIHADLINAIKTKLWLLDHDAHFAPGHGPMPTFGKERQTNPYIGGLIKTELVKLN